MFGQPSGKLESGVFAAVEVVVLLCDNPAAEVLGGKLVQNLFYWNDPFTGKAESVSISV